MPALKRKPISAEHSDNTDYPATDEQFDALAALQNALHFWRFLFLLAVVGGGIGWLIHLAQPPIYEATTAFPASIDFVGTGPMTQLEEDIILNAVTDLLSSDAVIQEVVDYAAQRGVETSLAELKKSTVIERKVNVAVLRMRGSDPQRIEQLANLWAEHGEAVLIDSYQHAVQADQLRRSLRALESCLAQAGASEPSSVQCSRTRFSEIQADLHEGAWAYSEEVLASRQISTALLFGQVDKVIVSASPVISGRSQLVLAGCLLGFFAGIWLVYLGIPARLVKRP